MDTIEAFVTKNKCYQATIPQPSQKILDKGIA